jgi:hypothetical protein
LQGRPVRHPRAGAARAALFERAKEEALRRANQAVEDLNASGLKYRLVSGDDGNKTAGKKPKETAAAGTNKKRSPS